MNSETIELQGDYIIALCEDIDGDLRLTTNLSVSSVTAGLLVNIDEEIRNSNQLIGV